MKQLVFAIALILSLALAAWRAYIRPTPPTIINNYNVSIQGSQIGTFATPHANAGNRE
ncbi:hypothetical protein [Verrucomicrobium sp. GAS474]|uniref:hypothetical protein n=1 Tax=Verrucomicrobium sp. GAS474 TaxID=1882831 RepID=UPI0012FF8A90|nr:hypothetical protein [Verrucomicrobium sp. GAS474]